MSVQRQKVRWNQAKPVSNTTPNQKVGVYTDCADIMFYNLSNVNGGAGSIYYINGMPLPAGASMTLGCNQNEILTGMIQVQGAKPVGTAGLWVQRKEYVD